MEDFLHKLKKDLTFILVELEPYLNELKNSAKRLDVSLESLLLALYIADKRIDNLKLNSVKDILSKLELSSNDATAIVITLSRLNVLERIFKLANDINREKIHKKSSNDYFQ